MTSLDIEREVVQLRALVHDLAARVARRRASYAAPTESVQSETPVSTTSYTAIAPVQLGMGDESDISDRLDWRVADVRYVVPLVAKQVRLQFRVRMTDQTSDHLVQFSVRPSDSGPEQVAFWVSAGSGDDIAAVGIADVAISDLRTVDYGMIGYQTFDSSSNDLGDPVPMDSRVGWSVHLIGYFN